MKRDKISRYNETLQVIKESNKSDRINRTTGWGIAKKKNKAETTITN